MGTGQGLQRLTNKKEACFPLLAKADYEVTSEETMDCTKVQYNCIAHAAGDQTRKWACPPIPIPGYFWPKGAIYGDGIDALVSAYETIGYEICDNGSLESGFEKIAVYVDRNGEWTHAAKQRTDGHWSSKLGDWEDIRHASVMDVGNSCYGTLHCYMRRKIRP
jgi:hypothetical protein